MEQPTTQTPSGESANGHQPHNASKAHTHNGANGSNGASMPQGIYDTADQLMGKYAPNGNGRVKTTPTKNGTSQNGHSPNGKPPKPQNGKAYQQVSEKNNVIVTDVPLNYDELPPPRGFAMTYRYVRGLIFAGWLFVRVLFWQVYVARYFPNWVERTNSKRWVRYARQFRRFAINRGGVYIKLGQFVSTRADVLPEEVIRELESLQDEVPTVKFKKIRKVIEKELGPLNKTYSWFNEEPIAAASLGQVHRARLLNGERVVVKVQRPNIRNISYADLNTLVIVANVAARFKFISRRADPVGLGAEFGRVLLEELSYYHEAANAKRFYAMFEDDMTVYIPEIYDAYSTDRVLTMEDVTAIKLNDYEALTAAGIDRKEVAERLMESYLHMVFEEFFFHADPHPGNLFIYPLPVEDIQPYMLKGGGRPFYLIFIDFGMTGTLKREIADGMVGTLAAVLARDPDKMIEGYNDLGFILPGADLDRIKEAATAAFDEVWGLSMTEIREMDYQKAADLATEFSDLLKTMPFYLPQDFIYLGRTIGILSGMATALDPEFNPWQELEPYARRLAAMGFGIDIDMKSGNVRSESVFQSLFNGNGSQALTSLLQEAIRRTAPFNPSAQLLEEVRSGKVKVVSKPDYSTLAHFKRLENLQKTTNRAVIFGSFLIASTVFYVNGETTIAGIGFAFCALSAVYGFLRD